MQKPKRYQALAKEDYAFAMALISNQRNSLLDRATAWTDVLARRELWSVYRELKGKITNYSYTHYMVEQKLSLIESALCRQGNLKLLAQQKS
jgi:ABC-type multidrug transport system ATPase subunit